MQVAKRANGFIGEADSADLSWRKSTASDSHGGACVEVAYLPGAVLVGDSKRRAGPTLTFTSGAWQSLLASSHVTAL